MPDGTSDGVVLSAFGDHLKRLVRRALGQQSDAPVTAEKTEAASLLRRSSGLREFWKGIRGESGLRILDLGAASQANITFITELGYKLYSADLMQSLLLSSAVEGADIDEQRFFRDNLNYDDGQFDGILCWDLFDFVADPYIKPLIERLHHALKPGGAVLTFFHSGTAGQQVPIYQYLIRAEDSLQMTRRGAGKLQRHFNNRTIENLFHDFNSLKFYLSRDNLREVISLR